MSTAPTSDAPEPVAASVVEPSAEGEPESLSRSAAVGVAWLTGQRWVLRLSGFATIAILARLLTPEIFGTVAVASAVLPLLLLLSDLGLSTYLVQAKDPDQRVLSTAFWFSLGSALVLAGACFACVPLVVNVLHTPEAAPVLRAMLVGLPLTVLASVPTALLRRQMRFRTLALQGATGAAIGQAAALAIAFSGGGAWALVAQSLCAITAATVFAWASTGWRPSRQFDVGEFWTMTKFGAQVVAVEFVALARNWAETGIVALSLGTTGLGYLSLAQRLVGTVSELGGSGVVPVSMVVLSKVREAPERLRRTYGRASAIIYAAVAPMLTALAVAAPWVVPLFFGEQWQASVSVTQGLAVAAILTVGASLDHALFYALGRAGRWFVYALATDAATVAGTAVAAPHGLAAVAWTFVGVALLATGARWRLVGTAIGLPVRVSLFSFARSMVPVLVSGLAGAVLAHSLTGSALVLSAITCAAVCLVHVVVARLVSPGVIHDVIGMAPIGVKRRTSVMRALRLRPREVVP